MSGPSLRMQDAHSSIHEAALYEAIELKHLLQRSIEDASQDKALQIADIMIEHWESRTLKHAEAEEEGLYKDMVRDHPHMEKLVNQLTRDHDLMRRIVGMMKETLSQEKVDLGFISLIESLIIIDELHNEDEMNQLLANDKRSYLDNHARDLKYGS
ncbi:hypothetical protein [Neobacillus sp. D3-1R]|uniref:hypothetical protein n=1 Tax=Neobacillus sp. D3-1R TaxID=3445778 RepID=UPI003FA1434A